MRASLLVLCFWLAGFVSAQPPIIDVPSESRVPGALPPIAQEAAALPPVTQKAQVPQTVPAGKHDTAIIPVQMRGLGGTPPRFDDPPTAFRIPFELPGPERLFRLDSEEAFFQRMRQEARERKPEELVFPEEPVLSKTPYYGRDWPAMKMVVEPHFVCHGRLYFEELNAERYGWELGLFQPLLSTANFYKDVILFPYHLGSYPHRCYDCSKGKCLPGDPVPLILYPPEITVTGTATEALAIAALMVMFP